MKIVTGMHRSGTSFVTQLLLELGMDLGDPEQLYAADHWNQDGYFENKEIMVANDRLILGNLFYDEAARLASPGNRPTIGTIKMALAKAQYLFMRSTNRIERRGIAATELLRELAIRYDSITAKDPRFTLTLSSWEKVANIERILFVYRHPYEVARSLWKRERLPVEIGLRLWAFHIESFLREAEKHAVYWVNYNRFFSFHAEAQKETDICIRFAGSEGSFHSPNELLDKILKPDLRHNTVLDYSLPPKVEQLYSQLEKCQAKSL